MMKSWLLFSNELYSEIIPFLYTSSLAHALARSLASSCHYASEKQTEREAKGEGARGQGTRGTAGLYKDT